MMNIEFLRRLFTACSDESDSHYADGLNLSELYQRLDETVVAEDELIASLKAEFDDDTSGRVDIAIYGYATACEQQGFINGARLPLRGVLRSLGGRPDRYRHPGGTRRCCR